MNLDEWRVWHLHAHRPENSTESETSLCLLCKQDDDIEASQEGKKELYYIRLMCRRNVSEIRTKFSGNSPRLFNKCKPANQFADMSGQRVHADELALHSAYACAICIVYIKINVVCKLVRWKLEIHSMVNLNWNSTRASKHILMAPRRHSL
jgi:hypothetical protein